MNDVIALYANASINGLIPHVLPHEDVRSPTLVEVQHLLIVDLPPGGTERSNSHPFPPRRERGWRPPRELRSRPTAAWCKAIYVELSGTFAEVQAGEHSLAVFDGEQEPRLAHAVLHTVFAPGRRSQLTVWSLRLVAATAECCTTGCCCSLSSHRR